MWKSIQTNGQLRVRRMLRATMPDELIREPISISFSGILQSIAPRTVLLLNRSWPKQSVTPIATGMIGKEELTAAAHWKVGTGDVVALAFVPNADEIGAIERAIARPPRDPRFSIEWHNGCVTSCAHRRPRRRGLPERSTPEPGISQRGTDADSADRAGPIRNRSPRPALADDSEHSAR